MADKSKKFSAIVLAAGKGVRMKSSLPKVLHSVRGMPLVYYVLRELVALKRYVAQIIVVVGHEGKLVEDEIKKNFPDVEIVYQKEQLGTAHAVLCAKAKVKFDNTLILCGDTPLIKRTTILEFLFSFLKHKNDCSLISAKLEEDNSLGRIIRDEKNNIKEIRERILLEDPQDFKEINSGIYACKSKLLFSGLTQVEKNDKKGEYFLTDIINWLYQNGHTIGSYLLGSCEDVLGINNPKELYEADKIMLKRMLEELLEQGVRIIDLGTTFIEEGVKIGENTVIFPFTFIEKNVIIGKNCSLGPFIRLRKGSRVSDNTHLGNFLEINRCTIGKDVRAKHFGYLGDAFVKDKANIGAGTVIANYDGKNKNKTIVDKGAFIGCDTVLVAPVKVGKNSVTGAGSVVTKNVKAGDIVVGVPAKFLKKKKG